MIRAELQTHNQRLVRKDIPIKLILKVPYSKKLCADNAVMIGIVASFKYQGKKFVSNVDQLERKPRWRIDVRA